MSLTSAIPRCCLLLLLLRVHILTAGRAWGRIDKTQFPFPYAQIMKILLYFWMLVLLFILQLK